MFKFLIHDRVKIVVSDEVGTIHARSEHESMEHQYLLRYKAADGRACESWWCESALVAVPFPVNN